MNGKQKLEESLQQKNNKSNGFLNIEKKIDGTYVRIPYTVINGDEEGPVLLVDACHHGNEYEGAEATINLSKKINPSDIKGTLILVHALNFDAFVFGQRVSPYDWSYKDLNRAYPGDSKSFITERIADVYREEFMKKSDYVISFHGGGDFLYLEPLVAYQPPTDDIGKESFKMAEAFGVNVLWRLEDVPFGGTMLQEAHNLGIPALTPEVGGQCIRHKEREDHIKICEDGIQNVMKHLGMIDDKIEKNESYINVKLTYIHADSGGIHKPLKYPLEKVKKGDPLSKIENIFGEKEDEVLAPFDGVVVGYWSYPTIQPGNWAFLYGKFIE